jgi:Holliday junction resolvase RusA-like endonuclease
MNEYVLRLVYPDLPPRELSPNSRMHWRRQVAPKQKVQADLVMLMAEQGWPRKLLHHADIRIQFGLPDKRRRDLDNLIASSKAMLDALKGRVIDDDDIKQVDVDYSWFHSPKKPQTIIEVRER